MRQVSRRETEKLGGVTGAPKQDLVRWTNPRTNRTIEIDRGLDPSWANNPGRDRPRLVQEAANAKIAELGLLLPAAAREAVRQILASPQLDRQMAPMRRSDPPKPRLPVGWLDAAARRMLQVETGVLTLDQAGAKHIRRTHPDVTPADIRRVLPAMLRAGDRAGGTGEKDGQPYMRLDWTEPGGTAWRAVVKAQDGRARLTTLFRVGRPRRK